MEKRPDDKSVKQFFQIYNTQLMLFGPWQELLTIVRSTKQSALIGMSATMNL